jgi:hypothetical protein
LEAGKVDTGSEGACGGAVADIGLERAASAHEEESEGGVGGGEVLEGVDELGVALEGAEAAYEAEEGSVEGEGGLPAGVVSGRGLEARGIDAVYDDHDFFSGKALADEAIAEGMGDGVHAVSAPVEEAADEAAVGGELRGGELGVLAMKDGREWGGENSVDQRTEIVGVDDVRGDLADVAGEGEDGGWGEPLFFSKDADAFGVGKSADELAAAGQAASVDFEFVRG